MACAVALKRPVRTAVAPSMRHAYPVSSQYAGMLAIDMPCPFPQTHGSPMVARPARESCVGLGGTQDNRKLLDSPALGTNRISTV
jgi:hypothetical protein